MAEWPITWPGGETPEGAEADEVRIAELRAEQTLRMLTLYRLGGEVITVMPCGQTCCRPRMRDSMFYPVLLDNGMIGNCWCSDGCDCANVSRVRLEGPVGRIDEVRLNGEVLAETAYHVEDSGWLVRDDGRRWPSCAGINFTVTYLNGWEVDELGEIVGGILANEFYLAVKDERKCRLPAEVQSLSRNGISMTFTPGLFPEGLTGIREVDQYIVQWNPNGLKVRPQVYSIDKPRQRTITG